MLMRTLALVTALSLASCAGGLRVGGERGLGAAASVGPPPVVVTPDPLAAPPPPPQPLPR